MNLHSWLSIFAGGPGSGRHPGYGQPQPNKSELARASYKPSTQAKQLIADRSEHELSLALGIPRTADNSPFDLHTKNLGIEVKTLVDNKNDKITMHPESRERKLAFAKANKIKNVFTVVVDARGTTPTYYWQKGVGSFRIGSMNKVDTTAQLRKAIGL